MPKVYRVCWGLLTLVLVACGGEQPVPTSINPDQALEDAGLLNPTEISQTATALAPTATVFVSETPTDTPTLFISETPRPTDTLTPTETTTLSPIQETEVFIAAFRTSQAGTATANVPPTETNTPTPTFTPSNTPFPTGTPAPEVDLPDNPAPNRLVFTSTRAGSRDIWVMDLDGSEPEPLIIAPASDEQDPACHPDGTRFAYSSTQDGDREIYLSDYTNNPPLQLTDTDGENFQPTWSPIDDRIAFTSTRDGQPDIWLMDSEGDNLRQITDNTAIDVDPSWSPDGKLLYFASNREGQFDLYVYAPDSDQTERLTFTDDLQERSPALSFDLITLSFIAPTDPTLSDTDALWTIPHDGGSVRAVITAQGNVSSPAWIDAARALVAADLGGITHILLIDLINTRQNILTNLGPLNTQPRPCFITDVEEVAELPTGQPATPTPTATLELITSYTAVINPGIDWREISLLLDAEALAAWQFTEPRLAASQREIAGNLLRLTWQTDAGESVELTLEPTILDGALDLAILSYTVDAIPQQQDAVIDLPFLIREQILAGGLPVGLYRLENIRPSEDGLRLDFSVPPEE